MIPYHFLSKKSFIFYFDISGGVSPRISPEIGLEGQIWQFLKDFDSENFKNFTFRGNKALHNATLYQNCVPTGIITRN